MNRKLVYTISDENSGKSIGDFLKRENFSHPLMVHLKKTERGIVLNGEWSYVYSRLNTGDTLEINIVETENSKNIPPTAIELDEFMKMVVYEDEDIIIMNKPAGLPVHPSMGHHEDTLANYCAYYFQTIRNSEENGGFIFRCVNRLDRDTSGLVLIAKNMLSSARLSNQQSEQKIHRTYLAVVTGETPDKGKIDLPIARRETSVIERCVDFEKGDSAVTNYTRLDYKDGYSLLEIKLETGRTHQIRVHMKAIGHPLPGDFLYNPDYTYIGRQALHSYKLDFVHPLTDENMSYTQPMPEDFKFVNWNIDYKNLMM